MSPVYARLRRRAWPTLRNPQQLRDLRAVQRLLAHERSGDEADGEPEVGMTPDQRQGRIDVKSARAKAVAGPDEVTRATLELAEEKVLEDAPPVLDNVVALASRR